MRQEQLLFADCREGDDNGKFAINEGLSNRTRVVFCLSQHCSHHRHHSFVLVLQELYVVALTMHKKLPKRVTTMYGGNIAQVVYIPR